VTLSDAEPETAWAAHVSDNYFTMLGVQPALGSLIRPGDLAAPVVVISHAFWVSRFARSPVVIGQKLRVNDAAFTIVGVAPEQFTGTRLFTYEPRVWLPVGMYRQTLVESGDLLTDRRASRFQVLARLRDGVELGQARENVTAFARRLADAYPELYRSFAIQVMPNRTPINPWLLAPERMVWIGRLLVLGVSLVLLIACANVASLLLARMVARREEIAIRLSLGASRGRLLQQLLTESVVLAALGTLAALPLTVIGSRALLGLTPHLDYASSWRPTDTTRLIVYSLLTTVGAAVVFGLAPALQTVRHGVGVGLRSAVPFVKRGRARLHLRELVLVAQVALSVIVLTCAALLVRSLREARRIDPGFAMGGAVTFTLDPQLDPAYDAARTRSLYTELTARLARLTGVNIVSRGLFVPLDGNSSVRRVFVDDGPSSLDRVPAAEFNLSSPGYFRAIGTPLVAGHDFEPSDSARREEAVIVNDVLARRLWPGESAIGKSVRLDSPAAPLARVGGVARASKYRSIGEPPRAAIWRDLDRFPRSRTTVIVRTTGDERSLVGPIRGVIREIAPSVPVIGLATLSDHVSLAFTPVVSGAMGGFAFGALALLLTLSGIWGLVSYTVSRRRRELGIRSALGARPVTLVWLAVARSVAITLAGVAVGLATLAVAPMGLNRILYGVSPHDPATLVATTILFSVVGALAALIPALGAARSDPMLALRLE